MQERNSSFIMRFMDYKLRQFIYQALKHHKLYLFYFFIIIIISGIDIISGPYLLKVIIDTATKHSHDPQQFIEAITLPAILYVSVTQLHNFGTRFYEYTCLKLFPTVKTELISQLFNRLSNHSQAFFQQHFSGDLSIKIIDLATGIENIVRIVNEMFLIRIGMIAITSIVLCTVHYAFALILLTWISLYVANGIRLSKKTFSYAKSFSQEKSKFNGFLVDSVANIVNTKIFTNQKYETHRIETAVKAVADKDRGLAWHILKVNNQQNWVYSLLVAALLTGLIYAKSHGLITIGDFALVLSIANIITRMIYELTNAMPTLSKEVGQCQQALETIYAPLEIEDSADAKPLIVNNGSIEFNQVDFSYSSNAHVFENLSVTIQPGEKVGLVGFSGGGKTTFVNLLLRLFEVKSGGISIDQQNISTVTRESLRQQIAVIPQQIELFNRSIKDNIRYGNIKASDGEVIEAAKQANCHDFILQLPHGYDSLVGERGVKLSGGQKQRIAIARAMLKQARILILDEATSALDSVNEQLIHESLLKAMQGKTTLVIAHRLATLKSIDRILFFNNGKIIEDGSIDSLLKQNGEFAKLWNMQVDGFLPNSIA